MIPEHLDLGRLDQAEFLFGRRVTRRAPGRFRTRVQQVCLSKPPRILAIGHGGGFLYNYNTCMAACLETRSKGWLAPALVGGGSRDPGFWGCEDGDGERYQQS